MSTSRTRILLIMLAAVVALAVGEAFLSKGMKQVGRAAPGVASQVSAAVRSGWLWAGVALLVLHLGLYMAALRGADLSFALPLTAASYPLAAVLAKYYLHEDVSPSRWIGTLLITVGVAIVALGEAPQAH